MKSAAQNPCPWCGSTRGTVRVHGHGQCATCKTNIEPCCSGDNTDDAACKNRGQEINNSGLHLFPRVFDAIGGRKATVTTEALIFGLNTRLGTTYDEARALIEAAERIGIIVTKAPGLQRLQDVATSPVDPPGQSL